MATQELQNFYTTLTDLANRDPATLARRELGEINFEVGVKFFEEICFFFTAAKSVDWEKTPVVLLGSLKTSMDQLQLQLHQIVTWTARGKANPEADRNSIVDNLANQWRATYTLFTPHLGYLLGAKSHEDLNAALQSSKEAAKAIIESVLILKNEAQIDRDQIQQILESVRETARETGVTQEAGHFNKLANRYRLVSAIWLFFAIIFGVVTFWYAGSLVVKRNPDRAVSNPASVTPSNSVPPSAIAASTTNNVPPNEASPTSVPIDAPTLIAALVPRLLRITLLLTGLVFCLRNFAGMMHNTLINRHRQTALTTFKTFVNSTADDGIKNAVLVQATQAIFLPQPSAYLKGDAEIPQVSQVYEIIKSATGKSKD